MKKSNEAFSYICLLIVAMLAAIIAFTSYQRAEDKLKLLSRPEEWAALNAQQDDVLSDPAALALLETDNAEAEECPVYTCIVSVTNAYPGPEHNVRLVGRISGGTQVEVISAENGFLCFKYGEGTAYAVSEDFAEGIWYASYPNAVDLRWYIPDAEFDILFASSRNITGHAMYPAIPLLGEKTAEKLKEAADIFRDDGYALKIYDAYRPRSAQVQLYDIVEDTRYIANPSAGGSYHQLGRAVDMSLIEIETGKELEMPTPMHTFSTEASRTNSARWTEAARKNVEYMTSVMQSVGFGIISTEWWHFEYLGPAINLSSEIDYSAIKYGEVENYS